MIKVTPTDDDKRHIKIDTKYLLFEGFVSEGGIVEILKSEVRTPEIQRELKSNTKDCGCKKRKNSTKNRR